MKHFDSLETRDPAVREAMQMDQLRAQLLHVQAHTAYGAAALAGLDVRDITDRAALARLPLLRKRDVLARQRDPQWDALGGLAAVGWGTRTPRAAKVRRTAEPFVPEAPVTRIMGRPFVSAGVPGW